MGRDDFLQLLVAQLKNQDPLSPANPEEFASQLAQFSSLEQLLNIDESLAETRKVQEAVLEQINGNSALELIGQEVRAMGDRLRVTGEEGQTVTLGLGDSGGSAVVTLRDDQGGTVAVAELGWLGPGRHDVAVADLAPELEPGTYTVDVQVTDGEGEAVEAAAFATHRIDGVRWGSDGPVLLSGSLEILLGDVIEVLRP
jgi:flagellar basal-body rod modification protein FlgD